MPDSLESKNNDPDETPTEVVIEGITQGLKEAIAGQTLPLSQMWENIEELEDVALVTAIDEGKDSEAISRDVIFSILEKTE